jgi:15-cis-phytoene desaturase
VAGFTGLPLRDRLNLVNALERLWEEDLRLPADLDARPATQLWQLAKQSEPTLRHIWTPLCRFLIGDEPGAVSAAVLATNLRMLFLGSRRDSAIGLMTGSLFETLVRPLETRLRKLGADLRVNHTAMQLQTKVNQVTGLRLENGRDFSADWYVSALPPEALAALLPERWLAQYASFQQLTAWEWSPRVCLRIDCRLEKVKPWLTLLADGTFDWTTGIHHKAAKSSIRQIWLVATGRPALLKWSDDRLWEHAVKDLRALGLTLTPDHIIGRQIFKTDRALPSLKPGTRRLRAVPQSPISNLFLAGAWTDTDLPANLEGALLSGRRCAEAIEASASHGVDKTKGGY